ncbi:MAG TPA: hypothetical protein VEK12_20135 [Alphaproteobacteria bacterium]|nr:hypothetical protein [Alphaproteobacteria bacterium]
MTAFSPEYLWVLAPPVALFLVGWLLLLPRNRTCLYAACCLIYGSVWVLALAVLWVGVVLAFAGWVWPTIFEPDRNASAIEKVTSAIVAWLLLFIGKKLLELRHLHIAAMFLKWLIQFSMRGRVPATLPIGPNAQVADRLAYRAFHEEQFAEGGVPAIAGWGISASYRRLKLINRLS